MLICLSFQTYSQTYSYHKAQLHCHSTNSDGVMSPLEVAWEYFNRGYEILFLTDHNYMTPAISYSIPGLLTINAEECTFDKHMNGFFLNHTVNCEGFSVQQTIDSVKAQGGLIQFNHPVVALNNDWSYNFKQFNSLKGGLDFIEVHNGGTDLLPFAKFNMNIWDSLLTFGKKIWGTFTDDMHHIREDYLFPGIDIGWLMINVNVLSADSVREALKRGDFYGSNGVEITDYSIIGNEIRISSSNANKIKFIGDWGKVVYETNSKSATFTRTTEKYIRIELEKPGFLGFGTKYAFTQPKFFDTMPEEIIVKDNLIAQNTLTNTIPKDNLILKENESHEKETIAFAKIYDEKMK